MTNADFYTIIDENLQEIIARYKNDEELKRRFKSQTDQKSYAFLVWFLEFYGKRTNYYPYITEGEDDNSCDIIFPKEHFGQTIYYVVQSKWNTPSNANEELSASVIKAILDDFRKVLATEGKATKNERYNERIKDLLSHIDKNGEVKFVIACLRKKNSKADENIQTFLANYGQKISVEIVDIERMKLDYIDAEYKKIKPETPLARNENPEREPVRLKIERPDKNKGSFVMMQRPFQAYIFLLRPSTIYELFERYEFKLFFKNVRNPLLASKINEGIKQSMINEPDFFWYFNNGITAITTKMPELSHLETEFEVGGLQIINGAQTVYAIYKAFQDNRGLHDFMNNGYIMLRLVESRSTDFNLKITRFTNSQNPIADRDFHANDDIQTQLQQESFFTKVWYERREGEFRNVPENVNVVSNEEMAEAYLRYFLQNPITEIHGKEGNNLLFLSKKEHKDGLYEDVFHKDIKYEDMLASHYIKIIQIQNQDAFLDDEIVGHYTHTFALIRTLLEKYLLLKIDGITRKKQNNIPPYSQWIIKNFENDNIQIIKNMYYIIDGFVRTYTDNDRSVPNAFYFEYVFNKQAFEFIKEKLSFLKITAEEIENYHLK